MHRLLTASLLAVVVLSTAGCSSNNTGKIVGKWKATAVNGAGAIDGQLGGLPDDSGMYFEFTADGKFHAYGMVAGQRMDVSSATYSLGSGDTVNLSNLSPPQNGKTRSRETVTINGDTMTIKGEGGKSLTFTRVK
jgi:hypothetical protein